MFVRKKRNQIQLLHSYRAGKSVRHLQIAAWSDKADLTESLARWPATVARLSAQHPGVEADWESVREALQAQHDVWEDYRTDLLGAMIQNTTTVLGHYSPALARHRAVIAQARPSLEALVLEAERLLGRRMRDLDPAERFALDEVFDDAMEHWWAGDRATACEAFEGVLREDPLHSDAHNHIAIVAMDEGRLSDAEHHLQLAIEGGSRDLQAEAGMLEWGFTENRPYLRAHGSLAHLRRLQGRFVEAARICEQILMWNPNDNLGVRWLIGEDLLHAGLSPKAVSVFSTHQPDEPGAMYTLALALRAVGREREAERWVVEGVLANRYIGRLLVGERVRRHAGWHASNTEDVEWAQDYAQRAGDLWRTSDNLPWLSRLLAHPAVKAMRAAADKAMLGDAETRIQASRRLWGQHDEVVAEVTKALRGEGPMPEFHAPAPEGPALVSQLRHFCDEHGNPCAPGPARRIGDFLGAITVAVLRGASDTGVPCRKRPERRPCPGTIGATREADGIWWLCPECGDRGRITHWEGTPWVRDAGG